MASGRYNNKIGQWEWENVIWERNKDGMFESNRVFPDSFWKQDWDTDRTRSAGVILIRKDVYGVPQDIWLVSCYTSGCFGFPKGKCEPLETFREAAQREFYEETGTQIRIPEKCPKVVVDKYVGNHRAKLVFFIIYVPHWYEINTYPISDVEITKFGWVNLRKLYKKNVPFRLSYTTKKILMNKSL
jgi:8-oxo-dGTP pyrophosphatase MutT (NUDIX family)